MLQTTWLTANLHDFGAKSRFSCGILILQTTCLPLFAIFLHDLGTKSRFSFWILILQTTWFTGNLHDLGTKSRFSFRILIRQKKDEANVYKCLQNPRCKINFGNLTFRILILQTTWFCVFLHFGILILSTTWFTAYLHDLGTKSRFTRFSFRILILQKKDETNVYKCLQKPRIHDAKLILQILLFGFWSSKLPGFECFFAWFWDKIHIQFWKPYPPSHLVYSVLHDFGTKSRFSFGILILQTSWFTAYLHDLGTKI